MDGGDLSTCGVCFICNPWIRGLDVSARRWVFGDHFPSQCPGELSATRTEEHIWNFSVQSYVYPWVLLVVLQLIMPNLSFLGHLSGILSGTLEYYGAFDGLFVSDDFMVELESLQMVRPLSMLESFVDTSRGGCQRLRSESSLLSLSHSMLRITRIVVKFFYNVLETILVCTCGKQGCRIGSQNTSMRFWWERQSAQNDVECGVIRPPKFYESDVEVDDDTDYDERKPLASRLV